MSTSEVYNRSRSAFWLRINKNDNGSYNFFVSEKLQEIFRYHFPHIDMNAPKGWEPSRGNTFNAWIPPDNAQSINIDEIKEWAAYAGTQCVWLNTEHPLEYCVAADFNFNVEDGKITGRTPLGYAEYWLKYKRKNLKKEDQKIHVRNVCDGIRGVFELLPFAYKSRSISVKLHRDKPIPPLVSAIPANKGKGKLSWVLTKYVANHYELEFVLPILRPIKPEMKSLSLTQKIKIWEDIYSTEDAIEAGLNVSDREVLIVDDLYQSGATIQAYARHLSSLGAKRIFGIVCVKSMRDSDNK